MNLFFNSYRLLTDGALVAVFPFLWAYTRSTGKYKRHLAERLGVIPSATLKGFSGSPRIWIHAVSLGEVRVAAAVVHSVKEALPGCSIIISTFTEHGRDLAEQLFGRDVPVIFSPLDVHYAVHRALSLLRPDIMVFMETEIWPVWLTEARAMGIKTALINGRISGRSIGGYMRFRPFFRPLFRNFDALSMISNADAERVERLGADSRKVVTNGNAKYDLLGSTAERAVEMEIRESLDIGSSRKVFIAGSTRKGEEVPVLKAYELILKEFPETILIIVPRHMDRVPEIEALLQRKGLKFQLRTDLIKKEARRSEKILVMNTFGELFKVYSVGTVVFCGGSLVPLGGQNPLEPAAWGKVVFYGPHMENFRDAKDLLEEIGAGIEVDGPETLAERAIWFMKHPEVLAAKGSQAPEAIEKNRGASKRHAEVIKRLVSLR